MNLLFPDGRYSVPGGGKPAFLRDHGYDVNNPALDDDDFSLTVRTAQTEFLQNQPDLVVESSRGGSVAMNIDSHEARLVVRCPVWKNWGTARTVISGTVIARRRADDVITFADTDELDRNSVRPAQARIAVGTDHQLATFER